MAHPSIRLTGGETAAEIRGLVGRLVAEAGIEVARDDDASRLVDQANRLIDGRLLDDTAFTLTVLANRGVLSRSDAMRLIAAYAKAQRNGGEVDDAAGREG